MDAKLDPTAEAPVSLKTWIAVSGALLGAFLAVLNIQITNASLPYIEGGISTGGVYGTWVSTAYLIGEIIVIPLTDFMSRVASLRRYLLVNTALFLFFSVLCGHAHSLSEMIVFRALQGFTGGVLIPLAFTIVMIMLPRSKQAIGLAGFAVSATFAPAIGPTIGGYLTDYYGWPWVFYVNLAPGVVMLAALWFTLPKSAPQLGLLRQGDWLGIVLMAVGLAAFQTVLDDGNVYNWFDSPFIVKLSLVAALALCAFVLWQFITVSPLVNFRLLGRRNFGLGTLGNFLLGFALYGSAFLLPQYLAVAQGFDAEQIGEVMAWTGLPQLLIIPLVPLLMKRIDARFLVGLGLVIFAASCFMNLWLDQDYAAPQFFWPDVIRAVGQAIVMTPISAIALVGIAQSEAGAASGLFNMMRNLGGAIGTAAVETFFTKREQFHSAMISPKVSLLEPATRDRLADLQRYFMAHGYPDPAGAMHRAIIAVGQTIRAEATIMGYADSFAMIGVVLLVAVLAVAMLRKGAAAGGAAH
ncbi:DHA2 family efflux MFS transporter permease subunit [Bradyrhizobium sp.]|uniref:DHA2 family efflux MFS transporter permease subunit n=1 Tax=Bradyrhizobium sp. TaxID=376 RepID=UPI002C7A41B3|nr:DHA2 family efflux MFS transporter permease subunit [Bradyrhizobium sp.]HWX64619.1 DHA2 family efflux MFS transporter permease subunit [Bradyrhizobium sp.]